MIRIPDRFLNLFSVSIQTKQRIAFLCKTTGRGGPREPGELRPCPYTSSVVGEVRRWDSPASSAADWVGIAAKPTADRLLHVLLRSV